MIFYSRFDLYIPPVDILTWTFERANSAPDRPVFLDAEYPEQKCITISQLATKTKQLGAGLRDLCHIEHGDVVLAFANNDYLYPLIVLGTLCAGGIFCGMNSSYGKQDFLYQLRDANPKVIFVSSDKFNEALSWISELENRLSEIALVVMDLESHSPSLSLRNLLNQGEMQWHRYSTLREVESTPAFLMYSSGTTGKSKGCLISHRNAVSNCTQILHGLITGKARLKDRGELWAPYETTAIFAPFYAAVGIQLHILMHVRELNVGFVLRRFSLPLYLSVIQDRRVNVILIVPPVAVMLAKSPLVKRYDLSSLQAVFCGAAPLGKDLHTQLEKTLSTCAHKLLKVRQAYGLTEIGLAASYYALDEYDMHKTTGVGYLVPNMRARVINEIGEHLEYGCPGEIMLKGPNVFMGYHKNLGATMAAFDQEGWLKTGDIGIIDNSGVVYIVDRAKEMIKVKGFQVAPAELEDLLLECADVFDAAVIGIPRVGTELVRAFVVPAKSNSSVQAVELFVQERTPKYKWLTGGVVFVDYIPKSPSGKILRRRLRDYTSKPIITKL